MGCTSSVPTKIYSIGKKKKLNIPQVVVFIPKLRIPVEFDIRKSLKGLVPRDLLDRLFSLRSQIILIAEDTCGSAFHELQRALEDYLPVLLGLTKKEFGLEGMVEFKWKNLLDGRQECCLTSSWFEVLSVVHMMAVLLLSEANALLINPTSTGEGSETSVPEERKKDAIELLIKASGYLEFCVRCILAPLPQEIKSRLPKDMQEGILEALSIQALGQGTELQLGLAVESIKATLSVKRRLACEQLAYYAQMCVLVSAYDPSCVLCQFEAVVCLYLTRIWWKCNRGSKRQGFKVAAGRKRSDSGLHTIRLLHKGWWIHSTIGAILNNGSCIYE